MSWIEWSENIFRGLDLSELAVDEAFFNITNQRKDVTYYLYSLSADCVKCPFKRIKTVHRNNETVVKIDTARTIELRLFDKDVGKYVNPDQNKPKDGLYWSSQHEMGEFGVYDLVIKDSGASQYQTAKEPVNTFSCESIHA